LWVTAIIVISAVLLLGVMYFWLHSLPERLGHKKLQFQIVSVLGLLALFTHMHIFWIIGLLLAVVDLPDFLAPLRRLADAAEKIADNGSAPAVASPPEPAAQPPELPPSGPIVPSLRPPAPQPKA
jgi:hypothetical protein